MLLAFPVAMALATGVEAPSSAIAQLGQLDDAGRRRFGRVTLWLTLAIVGTLTLGLTAAAVHLNVGIPQAEQHPDRRPGPGSSGAGVYAFFQLTTALLLLAAASSSFQAGPGLLKALSRREPQAATAIGILPGWLGRDNQHHTPYWGVARVPARLGGRDRRRGRTRPRLVLFYAVSVFISFLVGLLAMARFSHQEARRKALIMNTIGAIVVAFTLIVNISRGKPIASVAAALLIAYALHRLWVRAGRPRGITHVVSEAEHDE